MPDEVGVGVGDAEVLGGAQEVADAVVGRARAVAEVGGLHQAVVDDHRDAAVVGHAVARRPCTSRRPPPLQGRLDLELHVVVEALDLAPAAPAAVEHAQVELGEVGHEDVGEVDQDRAALHRVHRDDRQRHQDRVGVILLDRLVERRAAGRLVVDVAPDELDAVAHAPEDQHHLVVADRDAGRGQAARDRDRHEQRLVELVGPDLGVEVVAGLVQGEQSVDLLGTPGDLVEVAELVRPGPLRPARPGGGDDRLEIDGPVRPRLLRRQVGRDEHGDERRGPSRCDDANHEALLNWQRPREIGRPP